MKKLLISITGCLIGVTLSTSCKPNESKNRVPISQPIKENFLGSGVSNSSIIISDFPLSDIDTPPATDKKNISKRKNSNIISLSIDKEALENFFLQIQNIHRTGITNSPAFHKIKPSKKTWIKRGGEVRIELKKSFSSIKKEDLEVMDAIMKLSDKKPAKSKRALIELQNDFEEIFKNHSNIQIKVLNSIESTIQNLEKASDNCNSRKTRGTLKKVKQLLENFKEVL